MDYFVIKNEEEAVQEVISDVIKEAQSISLASHNDLGGRGIKVDDDCNETYEKGIEQSRIYHEHIKNVIDFISQVSRILMQADETVKTRTEQGEWI